MIRIDHLDKYYNRGAENEIHVLNDVSLELPDKGMIAVFGQSGCGKTTLLCVIGGLDRANSGTVEIDGAVMSVDDPVIRNKEIGVIFQNYSLNREETVAENVADALRLCGMDDATEIEERVEAALAGVGMSMYRDRLPDTLSGGQQQRVAIARAIVKNPPVLLADEPTGNLDETNTILVMDILKAMSKDRLVVIVTHEANLVDCYCDMVVELKDGAVTDIRTNENAGGYSAKRRNEIFLGELPREVTENTKLSVEYYGEEPGDPVKITVVNHGGRLFLKIHNDKVTILDESSEVKLREGVFNAKEELAAKEKNIDMSKLTPVEGKEYGRLFRFGQTVKNGFHSGFRRMMKKKSKQRLRACLALFGAAFVFLSAACSVGIRERIELRRQLNENVFLVCAGKEDISAQMWEALSDPDSGIVDFYTRGEIRSTNTGETKVLFRMVEYDSAGTFEGGFDASEDLEYPTTFLSSEEAKGRKLLAGKNADLTDAEVVITSELADRILTDVPFRFMKDYSNLRGMQCIYRVEDKTFTFIVAGVVDADEPAAFVTSRALDYISLYGMFGAFDNVFDDRSGEFGVKPGECIVVRANKGKFDYDYIDFYGYPYAEASPDEDDGEYAPGDLITYNGVPLKVVSYVDAKLPKEEDILNQLGYDSWAAVASDKSLEVMILFSEVMERQNTLRQEMADKMKDNFAFAQNKPILSYFENNRKLIIVHPEDFHKISRAVGLTDRKAMSHYEVGRGPEPFEKLMKFSRHMYEYGSVYYQVYSEDPAKTEKYLAEHFASLPVPNNSLTGAEDTGSKAYYTPEDRFDRSYVTIGSHVKQFLFIWVGVLVLMCICMYFIMKSTVMGRMREIGIYRAIGTSSKNVVFRFAVETGVVVTMSVILGYLAASAVVWYILNNSGMAGRLLYYPLWIAVLVGLLLYAVCIPCGILPVLRLAKKTPSEILAKYDI